MGDSEQAGPGKSNMIIPNRGAIFGSVVASTGLILAVIGSYLHESAFAQGGRQNLDRMAVLQPEGGKHFTRRGPLEAVDLQNARPDVARTDVSSVAMATAPTRGSFLANWKSASRATGYRLDVSTSSSFSSYLAGYEDLDVGNATTRTVSGLSPAKTYYYRVRAYNSSGTSGNSDVMTATTRSGAGLIINPGFDSSITTNPNSAAIEATINQAISIYESLFSDPITVSILFRYSGTGPDGTPLGSNAVAQSDFVVYIVPWSDFIGALQADATTSNDSSANSSLPGTA